MSELIAHLGINEKLLAAQAINFIIIFLVLKRFVFVPLMRVMRRRREEIAEGIALKSRAEKDLSRIAGEREAVLAHAREDALNTVTRAEAEARKHSENILQNAAEKSGAVIADAHRVIRDERARMAEEVAHDASELVRLGVAKVLGKMSSSERDHKLIADAMRELKTVKMEQ